MTLTRKPSAQTSAVMLSLAAEPTEWRYGYELCQELGIKAGSMYPILIRLADRGMLETTWESEMPAGRPPRHLYRLTGTGLALARTLSTTSEGQIGLTPRVQTI
ncbi:MAG TPA: helix-turn-helix transcriptional regulator [Acidimicrobiia bacterium]|nr:helix-turn-helix transcriptional regulator [Acidimicrobiia bacterium]